MPFVRNRYIKPEAQSPSMWALSLTWLLLWGLALGAGCLWFAALGADGTGAVFNSYFASPSLVFLNLLPTVFFAFFFFALTGRVWSAVMLSGLLGLFGCAVNFYKITMRDDPFMFADISLVSEAADMTARFDISIEPQLLWALGAIAVMTAISAFAFRARLRSPWLRGCVALLLLLAAGLCVSEVYFDDRLYNSTENISASEDILNVWSQRDRFVSRGFLYPFIYSAKEARESPGEGYNKAEARAALESYSSDDIPEDKRVNIIAIMLESYNDFSALGDLEFITDPYYYFHKLQDEGVSGNLVTNIFGGGTVDTERCFITGFTRFGDFRRPVPSYAAYFAAQGYTVEGGHPGYGWFYNRRNVNSYLGFENYYFYEDRYEVDDRFMMMDEDFFADILRLARENEKTDRPYFNFSVTYQNHGPYADEYFYDGQTAFIRDTGLSRGAYRIITNYLWGINQTDVAIEKLIEELRDSDEPYVAVLFGDHNPWLGDNSYVYRELGINLDLGTEEGFYNYYRTPFVIWANKSAKAVTGKRFTGSRGDMSPCFLMAQVFKECGYGGNAFMKAQNRLFEYVDVVNTGTGLVRAGGELTYDIPEDAAKELDAYRRIEYYMKRDY